MIEHERDVTVVDDLSTNVVEPSFFGDQVVVEIQPIEDYAPRSVVFDEIYHLAGIAGPAGVLPHAGQLGPKALAGIQNVMRLTEVSRGATLIASSSEVYGRPGCFNEHDRLEIYTPYSVRLEYAAAKLLSEISAINAARAASLRVNVARPFNICGPRQSSRGGFVVPTFFEAALGDAPIPVFGDGTQIRCFTHVRDIAASFIAIMESDCELEVFNTGNRDNLTSITELAKRIKAICASDSPIQPVDPVTLFGPLYTEAFDKIPDCTRLTTKTGWKPAYTLDDVLQDIRSSYTARGQHIPGPRV